MRFIPGLVAAINVAGSFAATCPTNGNNCARAVTGTFMSQQSSRRNDCSSFQSCTVYPATSTITSTTMSVSTTTIADNTVTVTATSAPARRLRKREPDAVQARGDIAELERRQANTAVTSCPAAIPSYASACTSGGTSVAYASACSCAGVSKGFTTTTTPLMTLTSTVTGNPSTVHVPTTTVTTTVPAGPAKPTHFYIRVRHDPMGALPDSLEGTITRSDGYVHMHERDGGEAAAVFTFSSPGAEGSLAVVMGDSSVFVYEDPTAADSPLYVGEHPDAATLQVTGSLGDFNAGQAGYPLFLNLGSGQTTRIANNQDTDAATDASGLPYTPPLYAIVAP